MSVAVSVSVSVEMIFHFIDWTPFLYDRCLCCNYLTSSSLISSLSLHSLFTPSLFFRSSYQFFLFVCIIILVALCKDGDHREVTQDNKFEYVELVARWKTTFSVSVSLNPFLQVRERERAIKIMINTVLEFIFFSLTYQRSLTHTVN